MSVRERLIERRKAADLEIKAAAKKVKKSYQYVRQLEEGINEPPTWELLAEFARAYNTSVDYLLGLTDDPRPVPNHPLPEGAQQMIEYLAGMSDRGKSQLLGIAKILFEDDREWGQRDDLLKAIKLILGETTLAAIEAELPAMLAESTSTDAIVRRIMDTLGQNVRGNGS